MKIRIFMTVMAAVAISLAGSASADMVIDDFTAGNDLLVTGTGTDSQTTTSATILGNTRLDMLNVSAANSGGPGSTADYSFDGIFRISQDVDVGLTGSLTYTGLNDHDFSQGGINDQLTFDFKSDIAFSLSNAFSVTATSGLNSFTVPVTIPASDGIVNIAFTEFPSVDFGQIDELELTMDFTSPTGAGRDIELNFVSATTAVPEPSTFALFGLASCICMIRRRR